MKSEWHDRVHVQVEDYLHGVVSVVNELVGHIIYALCILLTQPCEVSISCQLGDNGELRRTIQDPRLCRRRLRWVLYGMCSLQLTASPHIPNVPPQLNLKNDVLRKRFDGLKYDLKKIEEG